jgi:hypothetical protein
MASQSIEVHTRQLLHFDPHRLGLCIPLCIVEPTMRTGKLVPQNFALVVARLELANLA